MKNESLEKEIIALSIGENLIRYNVPGEIGLIRKIANEHIIDGKAYDILYSVFSSRRGL